MRLETILGTMTFGPQVNRKDSGELVRRFLSRGYSELDTAYVYNGGDSEVFLGEECKNLAGILPRISTKVHPRVTGYLDYESMESQLRTSLNRLQISSVDTLYLHSPDVMTPLEDTLKACSDLHDKGYFRNLGLSNYPAWQVVQISYLCKVNGWPSPTVYQGLYNGLSRGVELELIPALHELGIKLYAYNPLAGGTCQYS